MPGQHLALLADAHLASDDPGRVAATAERLVGLAATAAAVFILGDLFEVWLGVRQAPAHVRQIGEALRELRARGVRTGYVDGNRDFAVTRGEGSGLFDVHAGRELTERFGRTTFHLAHGDLINRRDRQYRLWRAVAKNVLAPAALRLLPDALCVGLGEAVERRLRRTNRRHKSYFPAETCLAYAREQVAAGADVVVVGHFHHPWLAGVEAGDRRGRFLSLPFWHQDPEPVLFDADGRLAPGGWQPEAGAAYNPPA